MAQARRLSCYLCKSPAKKSLDFEIIYSQRPAKSVLESVLNLNDSHFFGGSVICDECFVKLEEYDELNMKATNLQNELIEIYSKFKDNVVQEVYLIKEEEQQNLIVLKCIVCKEEFQSISEMRSHSHKSSPSKPDKFKVEMHETNDEPDYPDEDYAIEYLQDDLPYEEDVQDEKPLRSPIKKTQLKGPFQCRYCKLTFNLKSQHINHMRSHVGSDKYEEPKGYFKCRHCDTVFELKSQHQAHLKTHDIPKKFKCSDCSLAFKTNASLLVHSYTHQPALNPFECMFCHKIFSQKGALQRHMPMHTDEKNYQCSKCGKMFLHYSSFHMHMLAHDDIRQKKCDVCGSEFRSTSHLNRHKRIHTGEKSHVCPICNQRFAQRYNMTSHMKSHSGIRRAKPEFPCMICSEVFPKKAKLTTHLFEAHDIAEICETGGTGENSTSVQALIRDAIDQD